MKSTSGGTRPRAVVLGAGIGGLAAALGLQRQGWAVTVCERAAGVERAGSGISVAPNALRALDVLAPGLGGAVRARAAVQGAGGLRRPSGRYLARTSSTALAGRFGEPIAVLRRSELVSLLRERLPAQAVHTGSPG